MEIFPLLILVGAVVIAWNIRGSKSHRRPPQVRVVEKPREVVFPKAQPQPVAPKRFDAESARPTIEKRVLQGAAYITDGDTIRIKKTQVRLFGIDAPELHHPYGKKAKWALHRLCKGNIVSAEIVQVDAHGRTVARCSLPDGRDLSAEMVKLGLAIDWPKFSGGQYTCLETADARKHLFLADARQKGRLDVWDRFETKQAEKASGNPAR